MKKIFLVFVLLISMLLTGCQENRKYYLLDTQGYNYAYIKLPNGNTIEGKIEYWREYEDGGVELKIDGVVYYTSIINVVMTHD